jgi:hypothetical protein
MPKVEIDYSNTIIYKITCKDPNTKDVYVGHTTNFVQRKHAHKQGCTNAKSSNYNCKLYEVIRNNGGWTNWKMEIINFFDCKDHYEARKKEQEYFNLLNATLNSIEPMPKPKVVSPIENKKVKNKVQLFESNSKFYCSNCNYTTCRKSQYERHLSTVKHNTNKNITWQENASSKVPKLFKCTCGKEYKHDSSYYKHKKKCSFIYKSVNNEENEQKETPINNATIIELLKQNNEFKEIIVEQNKKFIELMNSINSNTIN